MRLSPAAIDDADRAAVERFEALYRAHLVDVTAYVRRRVAAEHVDDVVAETFLTAWRRIDEVPAGERGLFWLYHVAYRGVGHQWRGRSRRKRLTAKMATMAATSAATPEDDAVGKDEIRRVLEATSRLNESDAEILRLVAWEHLPRDAIAEVLGINPNAVSQRIHRARANLAKEFDRLERRRDRTPTIRNAPAARKGGTP